MNTRAAVARSLLRRAGVVLLASIIVSVLVTGSVLAIGPQTRVVPDAVTCAECKITLRRVAILGDDRGEGILTDNGTPGNQKRRRSYFVTEFGDTSVKVFGPDGMFLRSLGREGQGPGEFQSIVATRSDPTGALYVFDLNRRVSLFSPSLEYVESRTLPVSPTYNPVLLADSVVAMATTRSGRTNPEFPAHIIDIREGQRLRSLGSREARTGRQYVIAASAGRDGVWLVNPQMRRKRFELWSVGGQMTLALEGQADGWFERAVEASDREFAAFEGLPLAHPRVWGLFEDGRDHLWVFTAVPDPKLEGLIIEGETPLQRRVAGSRDDHTDIVIEVIDLRSGEVVARERIERAVSPMQAGLVQAWVEDEAGDLRLEILEVSLGAYPPSAGMAMGSAFRRFTPLGRPSS